MLKTLIRHLKRPFPEAEGHQSIIGGLLLASSIVFVLLYFLRPFGLIHFGGGIFWVCLEFGGITLITGLIYEYLLLPLLPVDRYSPQWTLGNWIISMIGLILLIAIVNYLFLVFVLQGTSFNWLYFAMMIGNTFIIALFPTAISGLIAQNRILKSNLQSAATLDASISPRDKTSSVIIIESAEREDTFCCAADELLYVESMQNYVNIWILKNGKATKHVLRNSLKNTCSQICNEQIIKCHRSFIINLYHVQHITGNAQGLALQLPQNLSVPVSRSFIKKVRTAVSRV